jgi:hypothetical protein
MISFDYLDISLENLKNLSVLQQSHYMYIHLIFASYLVGPGLKGRIWIWIRIRINHSGTTTLSFLCPKLNISSQSTILCLSFCRHLCFSL